MPIRLIIVTRDKNPFKPLTFQTWNRYIQTAHSISNDGTKFSSCMRANTALLHKNKHRRHSKLGMKTNRFGEIFILTRLTVVERDKVLLSEPITQCFGIYVEARIRYPFKCAGIRYPFKACPCGTG